MFQIRNKKASIVFLCLVAFCFSCREKPDRINVIYSNGYDVIIAVNDSTKLAIDDTVVFIFEEGFINDSIKILSDSKKTLIKKTITTDSFFAYADYFRVKRGRFFHVCINDVFVEMSFPKNIKVVFVNKDTAKKSIHFLMSNEHHFYQ